MTGDEVGGLPGPGACGPARGARVRRSGGWWPSAWCNSARGVLVDAQLPAQPAPFLKAAGHDAGQPGARRKPLHGPSDRPLGSPRWLTPRGGVFVITDSDLRDSRLLSGRRANFLVVATGTSPTVRLRAPVRPLGRCGVQSFHVARGSAMAGTSAKLEVLGDSQRRGRQRPVAQAAAELHCARGTEAGPPGPPRVRRRFRHGAVGSCLVDGAVAAPSTLVSIVAAQSCAASSRRGQGLPW